MQYQIHCYFLFENLRSFCIENLDPQIFPTKYNCAFVIRMFEFLMKCQLTTLLILKKNSPILGSWSTFKKINNVAVDHKED